MVPNDGRGTRRMELVELESAVVDEGRPGLSWVCRPCHLGLPR